MENASRSLTPFALTYALLAAWAIGRDTLAAYVAGAPERIAACKPDAKRYARAAVASVDANIPITSTWRSRCGAGYSLRVALRKATRSAWG